MSDIVKLQDRAMEIRRRYAALEKNRGQEPWDTLKLAKGFKKDVTDLIDIIELQGGDRKKLNHEIADCLWSVLVISKKLDIDIEKAFWSTMLELDSRLDQELL